MSSHFSNNTTENAAPFPKQQKITQNKLRDFLFVSLPTYPNCSNKLPTFENFWNMSLKGYVMNWKNLVMMLFFSTAATTERMTAPTR
ncbi:MAG: hypothetical protein UY41_C0039G0010 [Candidatus Moranbacteria bacterium GW2011_GWE1_49_15]|nr:MAG: hypothetical protein UY41_C0039G0010 [Candidatus Moranbacteria bacterium GW2011_GWE1_49_15]